jgi:hypothetical protein
VTAYAVTASRCPPSSRAVAQMITITEAAIVSAGVTGATAGEEALGAVGRLVAMMTAIHSVPTSTWATYTLR